MKRMEKFKTVAVFAAGIVLGSLVVSLFDVGTDINSVNAGLRSSVNLLNQNATFKVVRANKIGMIKVLNFLLQQLNEVRHQSCCFPIAFVCNSRGVRVRAEAWPYG